jgi:hypothetical protein
VALANQEAKVLEHASFFLNGLQLLLHPLARLQSIFLRKLYTVLYR